MDLSFEVIAFLLFASGFAGFVDAISGGGGLIQPPAMMVGLGNSTSPATVLGTNKLPSFIGTSSAVVNYLSRIRIDLRFTFAMAIPAFIGSFTGAHFANLIPKDLFRPIIVVMLILVALYTFTKKELAGNNPWGEGATTLEWTLSSPPPFHQFETLPRITGSDH